MSDVADAVRSEDVEGEAADAGEGPRLDTDPAVILAQGHVADVMVAVLDDPIRANRLGEIVGGQRDLADVERGLAAFGPTAREL